MARYKFPSTARLAAHFNIDEAKAATLRAVLMARDKAEIQALVPTVHPRKYLDHTVLAAVDILIGGYGVEPFETKNTGEWAEYVNTGDTYNPTLVLFRGDFHFTTVGDFIERSRITFK
jgi:hypothetical protein